MATQITQVDDAETGTTILRIEGEMFHEDAVLLERIVAAIGSETGNRITIDLADLDFLDSDAAPCWRRLAELEHGFEIEGMEIFLQSAVNDAESTERDASAPDFFSKTIYIVRNENAEIADFL